MPVSNALPVLNIILLSASLLLSVPLFVFFAEILLGTTLGRGDLPHPASGQRPRTAILIPAHDEAAGIAQTLTSLQHQLSEHDRILVVADNCSDQTALIAKRAGASVVERSDPVHRGKGYALDFGLRALESDSPEIVVMMDADCQLASGSLDALVRCCAQTQRPVQALYLMQLPPSPTTGDRVSAFAWRIKNELRPRGLRALGLPCMLTGAGMAFPWPVLKRVSVASGHLVEDMKLGLDLALAGFPALFLPASLVTSTLPTSAEAARAQRTRWEHGHLSVLGAYTGRLLARSVIERRASLLALALDLAVPPLSLLALIQGLLFVICLGAWVGTGSNLAAASIAGLGLAALFAAMLLAWWACGRPLRLFDLGAIPLYAIRKTMIYVRFIASREKKWVRTRRD